MNNGRTTTLNGELECICVEEVLGEEIREASRTQVMKSPVVKD